MTYTKFTNFIFNSIVDIPVEHINHLWDVYQERLEMNQENIYEYENIILEQIIYAYSYLKDAPSDFYSELMDFMMMINNKIYFYPITYFDSQWVGKVKTDMVSLISCFDIPIHHEVLFLNCLHAYSEELLQKRSQDYYEEDQIECIYEKEISSTISSQLTLQERQEYVAFWMEMYEELCDVLKDIPRYVIKNAVLHSYDNQLNITNEEHISLALGLCQLKSISSYEDAIYYLEKIYKDPTFDKYQNEYFCYGLLECLDWKACDHLKNNSFDFLNGTAYFKDTEEFDKLFVIAQNINDAWHDLSLPTVTSDFQAGLLYEGYQLLYKKKLLEEPKQEASTSRWMEELSSLVSDHIEHEIEIAKKLYQELMSNPTMTEDLENSDFVKQKIIASYRILSGDVTYENRRDLVVALLYSEKQMNIFVVNDLSDDEVEEIAQATVDGYKNSNFLNNQYKNKQVEMYIYEHVKNYYTSYYMKQLEQDIFGEIDLLVQSVCNTEEEMKTEIKMMDEIYEKLYMISKEASWDVTKSEILQALSNSYTTMLLEDGKLLDYHHRFNLTFGFLCAKYTSSDIDELARALHRIVVGDDNQDAYFIYGMIVDAMMEYEHKEDLALNDMVQAGINYSIDSEEFNIIWTIAESIDAYTHDLMYPKKEADFIKGIIYGTYQKDILLSKPRVKTYTNLN